MAETLKSNLIIPEVLSDYIDEKLIDNIVFAPLAVENNELVGGAGDTVTLPKYAYIGAADVVDENGEVVPVALSASSVDKKVHKLAKAVTITDEAMMSAYGDPQQEIGDQLVKSIADAADTEFVTSLGDATLVCGAYEGITSDTTIDALELFGEDQDGTKVYALSPADITALRKDDDFINKSDMSTEILIDGTIGEIWGCQMKPTDRLKAATGAKNRKAYILKQGALGLVNKRGVATEEEREAKYFRTTYVASKHSVPYLRDESKCVEIVVYTGLDTVTEGVVTSTVGTTATNDTFLDITEAAPANTKWVYKLGTTDVTPTWGTALTGYTDYTSATTEIAASTSTKAAVVLVWEADNKPLKYTNVALVKKS